MRDKRGSLTIINEKLDINGVDLARSEFISDAIYDFKLRDRKDKKSLDITVPLIFNKGIEDKIINITDFDMLVMGAFYNMYIKNYKDNIEEPNIVYLSDIYMRIHSTDKPQKTQREKIKKSIAKLRDTRVNIDYSNFLKNEEMKKRYGEQKLFNDLWRLKRDDMALLHCKEQEYIQEYNKKIMTRYVLQGLPLLNIATIKDRYFTVEPEVFNKITLSNTSISVTNYLLRQLNAKQDILTFKTIIENTNLTKDRNRRYAETVYTCLANIKSTTNNLFKTFKTVDAKNNETLVKKDIEKIKIIY